MISLNAFGLMARAACGRTMRKKRYRRGSPERSGCLELAPVDREDAGADDLRRVRGLVEREAERRRSERGDEPHGRELDEPEVGRERRSQPERRVQVGDVGPDNQLHDERRRAEEPDEAPRQGAQERRLRKARDREQGTEDEADRTRENRQLQGQDKRVDDDRAEKYSAKTFHS